ncbi:MAG: endolytic transglycosylase MltG [Clostridiales bacterium]|nr:endolytic transglycosylase MltG [Clostridiales bacterium]
MSNETDKKKAAPHDESEDIEMLLNMYDHEEAPDKSSEGISDYDLQKTDYERRKKAKDFYVDIRDDEDFVPAYNGEVYFSDPPHRQEKVEDVPIAKGAASEKKKDKKIDYVDEIKHLTLIRTLTKTFGIVVPVLIAITVISLLSVTYIISSMNDVLALRRDTEPVTITLVNPTTTDEVIDMLSKNDLIESKLFCKVFAKISKFRDDTYVDGVYYLNRAMGLEKMLFTLKNTGINKDVITLTFPEGWTVDQVVAKLDKYGVCSKELLYDTINTTDFSAKYSFLKSVDNPQERYRVLEGYLFPDTYQFYLGETAPSVIERFLDNFKEKWTAEYSSKAEQLGMSVDDVITLASIIQGEAANTEQMKTISSILHNRLNNPVSYPLLQCDCTGTYLSKYVKENVSEAEYERLVKIYDTHACDGLSAGAICNPGDDAINAALTPLKTTYFFFQHDKRGDIYLASNDAEHELNKQKVWEVNNR